MPLRPRPAVVRLFGAPSQLGPSFSFAHGASPLPLTLIRMINANRARATPPTPLKTTTTEFHSFKTRLIPAIRRRPPMQNKEIFLVI